MLLRKCLKLPLMIITTMPLHHTKHIIYVALHKFLHLSNLFLFPSLPFLRSLNWKSSYDIYQRMKHNTLYTDLHLTSFLWKNSITMRSKFVLDSVQMLIWWKVFWKSLMNKYTDLIEKMITRSNNLHYKGYGTKVSWWLT